MIYFANVSISFWFPRLTWMFYTKHLILGPKWLDWLCFIVSIECYGRLCHKSRSCKCLLWGPWPFFEGSWSFWEAKGLKLLDIEIPRLHYMLFDTQHVIVGQFAQICCMLGLKSLVLDWFKWHFWGHNGIPQIKYMLFDTKMSL